MVEVCRKDVAENGHGNFGAGLSCESRARAHFGGRELDDISVHSQRTGSVGIWDSKTTSSGCAELSRLTCNFICQRALRKVVKLLPQQSHLAPVASTTIYDISEHTSSDYSEFTPQRQH